MNQNPASTPIVRRSQRLLERRLREENDGLRLLARVASAFGDPEDVPATLEMAGAHGESLDESVREDYINAPRPKAAMVPSQGGLFPPAAAVSFDSPLAEPIAEDIEQSPRSDDSAMETDDSTTHASLNCPVSVTHTGLTATNGLQFTYFDSAQRVNEHEAWMLSQHSPIC